MNVIAVDPSLRSTGLYWTVLHGQERIEKSRTISTTSKDRAQALKLLLMELCVTLDLEEEAFDLCLVEGYAFSRQSSTLTVMGEVGGVIRVAMALYNIPVIEVAPALWQSVLKTGQMGLPKHKGRKYREMVNEKLGTAWETPDECDAYMMALAVSRIWKKNCFTTEAAEKVRRQIEGVLQRQPHLISNPPRTGEEISVGGVK